MENHTFANFIYFDHPVGFSWYDLENPPYGRLQESRTLLSRLIQELIDHGLESTDIFVMGFSQGGLMAIDQFVHKDLSFAGIVALSPRIKLPPVLEEYVSESKSMTPLFIAHGTEDGQISFQETENQVKVLKSHLSSVEFKYYKMGHTIDIDEIRDLRSWLNDRL
ncbi:MAG: hypothetical protein HN576_15550 [Bacteriovoracaceae bacterium]|nr:hypothetical protein [Bacteriovoracaceae bacterium]